MALNLMRLLMTVSGHRRHGVILRRVKRAWRSVLFEEVFAIFRAIIGPSSGRGCEALF